MAQGTSGSGISGEQQDVRIEDYLNDKLQTAADLDNLDALLKASQKQQTLLKEQVLCKKTPVNPTSADHAVAS